MHRLAAPLRVVFCAAAVVALGACSVSNTEDAATTNDALIPIATASADPSTVDDRTGEDATGQPASGHADQQTLRTSLRTVAARGDVWQCVASGHAYEIGLAFDSDDDGLYFDRPSGEPSDARGFGWSVTDATSILLDDADIGQQTDIRQILFDGDDRWTGYSARDGALDCVRAVSRDELYRDTATWLFASLSDSQAALDYWSCSTEQSNLPVGYLLLPGENGLHAHLSQQDNRHFEIDWRADGDLLTVVYAGGTEETVSALTFEGAARWRGRSNQHGELDCVRTAL